MLQTKSVIPSSPSVISAAQTMIIAFNETPVKIYGNHLVYNIENPILIDKYLQGMAMFQS